MPPESYTPVVLAIIFLATLARSTFGFGDALLAMPLLALVAGVDTVGFAKPLVAMLTATVAGLIVVRDWRSVKVGSAARLLAAAALGIPIGLFFLTRSDERLVKAALAIVVLAFSAYALQGPRFGKLKTDRTAPLFGFLAGILGGAYNTHGPPLVIYGATRGWPPEQFRATLQGYFLPAALLVVAGDGLKGLWSADVAWHYVYSLPLILAATWLGSRLNRRFRPDRFTRILYVILIGIALVLLGTALARR